MTPTPIDDAHSVDSGELSPGQSPILLPALTIILMLTIACCLGLAYAVLWLWTNSGRTLEDLERRVAQADAFVQGTVAAATEGARARGAFEVRQDFLVVQKRQISWGDVFHTLLDVPEGLVVDSISQSGFILKVDGRAVDLSVTNKYLTGLYDSGLFQHPQVQLEQIAPVMATIGPAKSPTESPLAEHMPSEPTSTASTPLSVPPTRVLRTSTPAPRPTETPTITPSFTNTITPVPAFEFALVGRTSTKIEEHQTSHIRAKILDENGNTIRGVSFRIESEGVPAWSAVRSNDDRQDGIVEFAVTKGVFAVLPLIEGRVQAARGLVTGYNDVAGKLEWELVWRRVKSSDSGLASPANTSTLTVTATPTTPPRWAGRNIARLGSATASGGEGTAALAIDGDIETIWQSGGFPIQEIVITLNDLYRKNEIDGIELIVAQSSTGRTTHQIWVEDENGNIHGHTTELNSLTRDRQTLIVRWDSRSVGDAEAIGRVFIRTVSGPSWVGWREIRIFEKVPPPRSTMTPTRTSTATATATLCPVPVCTATPTSTSTSVFTPTVTVTPTVTTTLTGTATVAATFTITATPTITPTPSAISVGQNIAARGTASTTAGADSAQYAIDGDIETTWQSGATGVQEIVIDLDDRYQVDAVALVVSQSSPGLTSHEIWIQRTGEPLVLAGTVTAETADRQTLPLLFNPALTLDRLVVRTIRSSGNVAWREIRIFEQLPPPLSTLTPTRTHTTTPTATPTFISVGRNVAPLGSASATSGSDAASLAIDNDPETAWETSVVLSETFTIELDRPYTVEAISLVAKQSVAGSTTHQVLIEDSSESLQLIRTLAAKTADRETLAIVLDPAVEVAKVIVKTTDAPGNIGWREIRIFEQPPPTPLPSENSEEVPRRQTPAANERLASVPRVFPGIFEWIAGFLRVVVGQPAGTLAAPAAQTPINSPRRMGIRFKLVLEVEPGSGYVTRLSAR